MKIDLKPTLPRFGASVSQNSKTAVGQTVNTAIAQKALSTQFVPLALRFSGDESKVNGPWNYTEYIKSVFQNPERELRNTGETALAARDYYNRQMGQTEPIKVMGQEVTPSAFKDKPWLPPTVQDRKALSGQDLLLDKMFKSIATSAKQAHPTRGKLIVGPYSSAKTTLLRTVFEMLEAFSKTPAGMMKTFNFVFRDRDSEDDGMEPVFPVAGGEKPTTKSLDAPIPPEEVGVTLSVGNTHPILLLPPTMREKLLQDLIDRKKLPEDFNKDPILLGELDTMSQKIRDTLFNYYMQELEHLPAEVSEDPTKGVHSLEETPRGQAALRCVLNHVQVVPFRLSIGTRNGLVWVPALETPDAGLKSITPKIDWSRLPSRMVDAFRTAGLEEIIGATPNAHRGHLFYDDMFKGDPTGGKSLGLLEVTEKGSFTVSNGTDAAQQPIEAFVWGATNDLNVLGACRSTDTWRTLKERIDIIKAPPDLRYKSLKPVLDDKLRVIRSKGRAVDPEVTEALALFTVMTYLYNPNRTDYYEKVQKEQGIKLDRGRSLYELVHSLNAVEKALLYQGEDVNLYKLNADTRSIGRDSQKVNVAEQAVLQRNVQAIHDEFDMDIGAEGFPFYEGNSGISIRDVKESLLPKVLEKDPKSDSITLRELFEVLEDTNDKWSFAKFGEEFRNAVSGTFKLPNPSKGSGIGMPGLALPMPYETGTQGTTDVNRLVKQLKEHYQRKVRYRVYESLDLIQSEASYQRRLGLYVAHAMASTSKRDVDPAFWDPRDRKGVNEELLRSMEKIIDPTKFSSTDSPLGRQEFRRDVATKCTDWLIGHPSDNMWDHLPEIFPDIYEQLKRTDIEESRKRVVEFLYDYRQSKESPDTLRSQNMTTRQCKRIDKMEKAVQSLEEKGYPPATIGKLIAFAFNDTSEQRDSINPPKDEDERKR
jgi:predicted Ser/Thr protein kinase